MTKARSRKWILLILVALIALALIIGGLVLARNLSKPAADTEKTDTSRVEPAETPATNETDTATDTESDATAESTVDPATLSSIDVEPLGITVFYAKGTPGFGFTVKKTTDQTQYVDFSAEALIGTKCTGDEGVFAAIIKNPKSTEDQTTISKTAKVGSDSYGLSLSGANCTSDEVLFKEYQDAFSAGFANLTALAQ
jgi:cytoskeletal protein RodZ